MQRWRAPCPSPPAAAPPHEAPRSSLPLPAPPLPPPLPGAPPLSWHSGQRRRQRHRQRHRQPRLRWSHCCQPVVVPRVGLPCAWQCQPVPCPAHRERQQRRGRATAARRKPRAGVRTRAARAGRASRSRPCPWRCSRLARAAASAATSPPAQAHAATARGRAQGRGGSRGVATRSGERARGASRGGSRRGPGLGEGGFRLVHLEAGGGASRPRASTRRDALRRRRVPRCRVALLFDARLLGCTPAAASIRGASGAARRRRSAPRAAPFAATPPALDVPRGAGAQTHPL